MTLHGAITVSKLHEFAQMTLRFNSHGDMQLELAMRETLQ